MWHDGPLDALVWDGAAPVAWSSRSAAPRSELAAALIARLAGVTGASVRLTRSAAGAPLVAAPAGWHLGLSGRDGHHLIAAARLPVACDREPLDDAPPLWDMLAPPEAAALRALPAAAQARAWLRVWTAKEAHAKLVGEPRRIAPEQVVTIIASPEHATATFEGTSACWTREAAGAIETVAVWANRS